MKSKILIATILACLLILNVSIASAASRIMPLGDSITSGVGEIPNGNDASLVGYRQFLWEDLIASGCTVDLVGSLNSGYAFPGFDYNHEGHGGWRADMIADNIYQWLVNNPADIILLHIGTNDITSGYNVQTTVSRVENILNNIDSYESAYNSEVTVILAQIIDQVPHSPSTSSLNQSLYNLAVTRYNAGDRIALVDMEHALVYPGDMYDQLHPNSSGYSKMANVWLGALQTILSRLLTVQKSGAGQGRVTSLPSAIDCGSTCNASLPHGTVVNLTATADYGSAFSYWTGCDTVNGNICTITLDSNWTVTARFSLITEELTVQKSGAGQGRVTSFPEAIDCGTSCSASFVQGTVINLSATADNGSAFSNWVGCDSANGNTCAVTMNSNLTVTAIFRTINEVKLLSPNGGEIIPTGSEYPISWEAPPEAFKFKFITTCSGRQIAVNTFTVNNAMWDVPLLRKNKTDCVAKVTAYDSANREIGSDVSDGTFTIESVRITSPNQGDICKGGQIYTITWTKSDHVPAASTHLSYTCNEFTWHKIPVILPGNAESFDWIVPAKSELKTQCKVKVVLRDNDGQKVGSDVSDGRFTIQLHPNKW